MDAEIDALVRRWIIAFCEMPVLIDAELMRAVLADVEAKAEEFQRERQDLQGR